MQLKDLKPDNAGVRGNFSARSPYSFARSCTKALFDLPRSPFPVPRSPFPDEIYSRISHLFGDGTLASGDRHSLGPKCNPRLVELFKFAIDSNAHRRRFRGKRRDWNHRWLCGDDGTFGI